MDQPSHSLNEDEIDSNATANIIFNLSHLGISLRDSKYFDIQTYLELLELEMKVINGKNETRKATQQDIDLFLL